MSLTREEAYLNMRNSIIKIIKIKMAVNNFTQKELARKVGISQSTISEFLNGKKDLSLRTLGYIFWALDCEIEFTQDKPNVRKYRHIKRGTEYTFIGEATLQTETPLPDNAEVVVYIGDEGKLWVRSKQEFTDGRFVEVQS